MKRCLVADKLKAYACFLVVLGHVVYGLNRSGNIDTPQFFFWLKDFIWSYHIPLFMFLSGFVYKFIGGWQHKGSAFKFILNKLVNLAVPYFVFSSVYIIINSKTPGANTTHSLSDIATLIFKPVDQFWFIYALFFCFLFTVLLELVIKNRWITLAVFAVLHFIPNIFPQISYGFLDSSVDFAVYFYLGTFFKELTINDFKARNKLISLGLIIAHIGICYIAIRYEYFQVVGVKEFLALLGIFSSVILINLLNNVKFVSVPLLKFAKYSFTIYLIHTIFTAATRILLIKLSVTLYIVQLIIGLIAGIGIPVIISIISKKIGYTEILFTPTSKSVLQKFKGKKKGE